MNKTYFAIIVDDLDPFALGRNDPGPDRHIEFSFGAGLDPDIVALIEMKLIITFLKRASVITFCYIFPSKLERISTGGGLGSQRKKKKQKK